MLPPLPPLRVLVGPALPALSEVEGAAAPSRGRCDSRARFFDCSSGLPTSGSPTRDSLRRRAGFTLLEILLSIALIALLAGALVGGAAHLLTDQPVTADEVFWKAVQEARKIALKGEKEVRLRFDGEKKQFVLIDGFAPRRLATDGFTEEETVLKQFVIPPASAADLTIDFLGANNKGGPLNLIGGMVVETQPIGFATFYSDGTCSPFRAQIMRKGGTHVLSIDPWTCAAVLVTDPNARTP